MNRFINPNETAINLSTLRHQTVTPDVNIPPIPHNFYRGPLPLTDTCPDNVVLFYDTRRYKSGRLITPAIQGQL